MLAAELTT